MGRTTKIALWFIIGVLFYDSFAQSMRIIRLDQRIADIERLRHRPGNDSHR